MKSTQGRRVSHTTPPGAARAAADVSPHALRAVAGGRDSGPAHGVAALTPGSLPYGIACRFFGGFARLPGAWLPALDEHAHLFDPAAGPLSLGDREAIARALRGDSEHEAFGAPPEPPVSAPDGPGTRSGVGAETAPQPDAPAVGGALPANGLLHRRHALRSFARAWSSREELQLRDVERLIAAGFSRDEIRTAVRACLAFSFVERLCSAASLQPPPGGGCAAVAPLAASPATIARRRAAAR